MGITGLCFALLSKIANPRKNSRYLEAPYDELEAMFIEWPAYWKRIRELKFKRVLDAGCGEGLLVFEMRKFGIEALGLDLNLESKLSTPPNDKFFKKADIRNTGFPDGYFDYVYSNYSIFSYPHSDENLLNEFSKKIAPAIGPDGKPMVSEFKKLLEKDRSLSEMMDRFDVTEKVYTEALKELARITKVGGKIRLTRANSKTLRIALERVPELKMTYEIESFPNLIELTRQK